MNLDGLCLEVSATAAQGVVGAGTCLRLVQQGTRVLGRYQGGRIARGCLVGNVSRRMLAFRYVQREASGELHAGRSTCDVIRRGDGRMRIVEHFRWDTREGTGTNVFDEV
jgi:hypothetical protein